MSRDGDGEPDALEDVATTRGPKSGRAYHEFDPQNIENREPAMILRSDRIGTELPPPSDPDPAGAAAVQELLGGRFGEMSTFLNYTFQSFNFRGRQDARPFYDLIANIAAEEFGHVELVAATINTMLTGASSTRNGKAPSAALRDLKGVGNPHHFLAGGQGALPQNSQGRPWTETTSSHPATSSKTSRTTSFSRPGRATTNSRSMRWSSIPPHGP